MYWICILILALASPAIGDFQPSMCPSESLSVDSDCDLPVSTDLYSVEGCNRVKWSFYFTRTDKIAGRTIIYVRIDSVMTDSLRFDSDDYPEGQFQIDENDAVYQSPNRLRIEIDSTYSDCGHFEEMRFKARYYNR